MKKLAKYDKKLHYLKNIGKEDMKLITCFILITEFSLDLEKTFDFFNKEIKNYKEKLANF